MTTSTMEKIKVMLAFDKGEKIEYQYNASPIWRPVSSPDIVWNWDSFNYRIAPQAPRKFTRWFLETPGARFIGPFYDEDTATQNQCLYSDSKVIVFEMTEIPQNAS